MFQFVEDGSLSDGDSDAAGIEEHLALDQELLTSFQLSGDGDEEEDEPSGPSLSEQWWKMAEGGDIHGLMAVIAGARWNGASLDDGLRMLRTAVTAAVRKDPTAFVQLIGTEMLGAIGGLVMRGNLFLQQILADQDDAVKHRNRWSASRDLEEFLPGYTALQLHFAELAKLNASTQRLGELARQHELANAKATPKRRSPRPRKSGPPSRIRKQRRKPKS